MAERSRRSILDGLQGLMGGPRPSKSLTPYETFGFSLLPPGTPLTGGKIVPPRDVDDRAIALICATVIEQSLEVALNTKFIPLSPDDEKRLFFDERAPLSGISAKIRMAFSLGIIGRGAMADLELVRKVRNAFAHSREHLDFDRLEIADAVGLITLPGRCPGDYGNGLNARELFISVANDFAMHLVCYDPAEPPSRWRSAVLDLPAS